MRKFIIILLLSSIAQAADTKLTGLTELTSIADADLIYVVDDPSGTPLSKKITVLNLFDTIDTFAELNTIVADKTLVNEEDAVTWDALATFGLGITITTGDPFTFGVVRWDNGSDLIDGEQIAADTIDNDSIDWGDMTDLTTDGAVVWGNIAEGELANSSVVSADIKDGDIAAADIGTNAVQADELDVSDVSDNIAGDIAAGELTDDSVLFADLDDDGNYGPFTGAWDWTGGTLEIPNAESTDAALTAMGMIHIRGDEDRISAHVGTGGEVAGEVTLSVLSMVSVSFDPGLWYDSDSQVFLFEVHADKFPNGIIIDEWKVSCNVDPDVEMNANIGYADTWFDAADPNLVDVIDTTAGVSSEDTDANINSGNAIAAGKCLFLYFDADPEGTAVQMNFTVLFHAEED